MIAGCIRLSVGLSPAMEYPRYQDQRPCSDMTQGNPRSSQICRRGTTRKFVRGVDNTMGVALVEAYDLNPGQ